MIFELKERLLELRKCKSKGIILLSMIFVVGQILFLTSKSWIPNSDYSRVATQIYEEKGTDIKCKLMRWEYVEADGEMEIEVSIINNSILPIEKYEFDAFDHELTHKNVKILAQGSDYVVARISGISKRWREIAFSIQPIVKEGAEAMEEIRLYANKDSIKEKKNFTEYKRSHGYYLAHLGNLIKEQESLITKYAKSNTENQKKQKEYALKILELKDRMAFQTGEDANHTQSSIDSAETEINTLQKEIDTNNENMKLAREKISLIEKMLKEEE